MPASPVSAPDRQALEQRLQHLKSLLPSLPDAPSATPAPPPSAPPAAAAAPVAGPPTAATQMQMLEQQEQGRLAAERTVGSPTRPAPTLAELGRGAAATGISATGAMLGTAAGTLAAPFFGPAAPAIPLVGEMAGSYLARQANVALGLEDPGTLGDVLSVATPGIFGLRGVVRGLRQAPGPNIPMVPRGREQMAAEAQAAGVPLSYGEMTNQPLVKRAETALEQVPFVGTSGARRRQQEAVTQAATAEATWLREQMVQTPWRGLAEVQQAAQQGNRQAQQVLDDLNRAGEDWPRIVQASGNLRAYRARQVANRLYNRVEQLTQGMGYIEPARSTQVLDTVIQELDTAVVPDPGTQRLFEQMRERLLAQPRTYQQMRQFDSDVGDMVRDYYQGTNAVVGAKGVGSVTRLRAAIREDMDTFALQSGVPEVQEAVRRANRFYQRTVIPYEDKALAQALASETPDEIYRAFIQRGHRDRAQNFYTALDQRGRAAVQYGMVSEAMEKAMQPTTGLFSPAKFAGELERIREARGVFFRGQDAWQLDGLTRVMRAAERAGQFAENPPTGQRVIPWLILGGAGAGAAMAPGALAGTAAATRGLSWLLTSPAGSRLLLRAHRVGQETLAMQNILREIGVQGARVLATEGGEGVQEGTQVQVEPGRVTR